MSTHTHTVLITSNLFWGPFLISSPWAISTKTNKQNTLSQDFQLFYFYFTICLTDLFSIFNFLIIVFSFNSIFDRVFLLHLNVFLFCNLFFFPLSWTKKKTKKQWKKKTFCCCCGMIIIFCCWNSLFLNLLIQKCYISNIAKFLHKIRREINSTHSNTQTLLISLYYTIIEGHIRIEQRQFQRKKSLKI